MPLLVLLYFGKIPPKFWLTRKLILHPFVINILQDTWSCKPARHLKKNPSAILIQLSKLQNVLTNALKIYIFDVVLRTLQKNILVSVLPFFIHIYQGYHYNVCLSQKNKSLPKIQYIYFLFLKYTLWYGGQDVRSFPWRRKKISAGRSKTHLDTIKLLVWVV